MSSQRFSRLGILALAVLIMVSVGDAQAQGAADPNPVDPVPVPEPDKIYSYAVKFVCGFNGSNLGTLPLPGLNKSTETIPQFGEAPVKIGNYATEVNIFNPSLSQPAAITKKVIMLFRDGDPVGEEPRSAGPKGPGGLIDLNACYATADTCNKILQMAGEPVPAGAVPGLHIGYLVLQSTRELDVTAVYTAEICTDFVFSGGTGMCLNPDGLGTGAGISIDVEQIEGKCITE